MDSTNEKFYSTGRRKEATARCWLYKGTGKIIVNNKTAEEYFKIDTLIKMIKQPFVVTHTLNEYDIFSTISGSGKSGQAGALKHAISIALDEATGKSSLHSVLRKAGLLTRDSRVVERKKYGQKKARKKFQYTKR